jgi:hypothetical protein
MLPIFIFAHALFTYMGGADIKHFRMILQSYRNHGKLPHAPVYEWPEQAFIMEPPEKKNSDARRVRKEYNLLYSLNLIAYRERYLMKKACCFCAKTIEDKAYIGIEKEPVFQDANCHIKCLKEKTDSNFPIIHE